MGRFIDWKEMRRLKEVQVEIEEVARVALEDPEMRSRIGHELDLSDEYLVELHRFLESYLNEEV